MQPLTNLFLKGKVISGQGSGKKFLGLPWVFSQIEAKLGYAPFLGTLNLKLDANSVNRRKRLIKAKSETIFPSKGYCVGLLVKARLNGLDCGIVLPQVPSYPNNLLEIVAATCLRESLHLKDGDAVEVAAVV